MENSQKKARIVLEMLVSVVFQKEIMAKLINEIN